MVKTPFSHQHGRSQSHSQSEKSAEERRPRGHCGQMSGWRRHGQDSLLTSTWPQSITFAIGEVSGRETSSRTLWPDVWMEETWSRLPSHINMAAVNHIRNRRSQRKRDVLEDIVARCLDGGDMVKTPFSHQHGRSQSHSQSEKSA